MLVTVGFLLFQDGLISVHSNTLWIPRKENTAKRWKLQYTSQELCIETCFYLDLHDSYDANRDSYALLWELCVHARSCWFNSIGFCVPCIGLSEIWEVAQEARSSPYWLISLTLLLLFGFLYLLYLGCVGAVRLIVIDMKTCKFFHDMWYYWV